MDKDVLASTVSRKVHGEIHPDLMGLAAEITAYSKGSPARFLATDEAWKNVMDAASLLRGAVRLLEDMEVDDA